MSTPIWTGNDAWAQIYACDAAGNVGVTVPLVSYCFFNNCSLYGGVDWEQRPGFGNPKRNLESEDEWDLFHFTVDYFYMSAAVELNTDQIFNRDALLYIELWLFGDGQKTDEVHVLKVAHAASWRLSFQDNNNAQGDASFLADSYSRTVAPLMSLT